MEFVFMPNHLHGIIRLNDDAGIRHAVSLQRSEQYGKPVAGSIPTIIRSYKSAVTKCINESRNTPGAKVWQANYWEHIIRNEKSYSKICYYIKNNVAQWLNNIG